MFKQWQLCVMIDANWVTGMNYIVFACATNMVTESISDIQNSKVAFRFVHSIRPIFDSAAEKWYWTNRPIIELGQYVINQTAVTIFIGLFVQWSDMFRRQCIHYYGFNHARSWHTSTWRPRAMMSTSVWHVQHWVNVWHTLQCTLSHMCPIISQKFKYQDAFTTCLNFISDYNLYKKLFSPVIFILFFQSHILYIYVVYAYMNKKNRG